MLDEIIIATNNQHKIKEFARMLSPIGIKVISLKEAGIESSPEENADTFEGNAYIKAMSVYELTGKPVAADDSGLCVDALNGAPGIHSARYGGEGLTDKERTAKLLNEMAGIPKPKRTARFVCAISLVVSTEQCLTFTGKCEGEIGFEPIGENGFGYDPVFMVDDESFSTISGEVKDSISHRGNALKKMLEFLDAMQNNSRI